MVPLARTLGMDAIGAELESLASATLRRARQRPGTASGHLLAATTALLPAGTRARWREEWLAELQVLPTRRERARFAVQIVAGIGRLAITLYQAGALLRQVFSIRGEVSGRHRVSLERSRGCSFCLLGLHRTDTNCS